MQFQSDLLGVPVVRPRIVETTALARRASPAGGRLLEEPGRDRPTLAG
jgi:glycerol kinase